MSEPAPAPAKRDKAAEKAKKAAAIAVEDPSKLAREYVNPTPPGEFKSFAQPMAQTYHPHEVEAAWNAWWEASGYYTASSDPLDTRPKFSICLPPPNVTGSLHLGHALTAAVQDLLIRWHKMRGFNVLWIPGTDHAGIATQTVVEKKLKKDEGITRHDLGREAFVGRVLQWKEQYGDRINMQLRRLGCALDWSRSVFTMDAPRALSVTEAFVTFHERGLLYRGVRLTNWCSQLKSAISDIEVEHLELDTRTRIAVPGYEKTIPFGVIWAFAYAFADGSGEIVVATTRPETMLGDVAVAVHPLDPRYAHCHGKRLVHPFLPDREMRVICDDQLVQMEFGTGAVKVTPAHDPNDFKCGQRHGLPMITVLDDDGNMNAEAGEFCGQKRFDCRFALLAALKAKQLFRGEEDNAMRLGVCSRTGDVIEPLLKPQWWVRCEGMAKRAADAVRCGDLKITPSFHEATWFRWLDNIQDWCVSRQLWWGHRIPAYYVRTLEADGSVSTAPEPIVARSEAAALEQLRARAHADGVRLAGGTGAPGSGPTGACVGEAWLEQDEDVLDTWFSSGLFPFSCLGWPDGASADLRAGWHPTSLLETGHDILFFWVARMAMCSLELTGKLPFTQVYLHAMVRDKHGRKMSKSLGNVIDPLEVIGGIRLEELLAKLDGGNLDAKEVARAKEAQTKEFPAGIPECGSDALRFGLLAYTMQGRDVNLDILRVLGYRQFCNKLWQATRFVLGRFPPGWRDEPLPCALDVTTPHGPTAQFESLADGWILARLHATCAAVNAQLATYEIGAAVATLYAWWYDDFCSTYIEAAKSALEGDSEEARRAVRLTLFTCLHYGLRLLHPFMPFVTEELYQRVLQLCGRPHTSVMLADYPDGQATAVWANSHVLTAMDVVKAVAAAVRTVRAEYLRGEHDRYAPHVFVAVASASTRALLVRHARLLSALARSSLQPEPASISIIPADCTPPRGCALAPVSQDTTVFVLLSGVVDLAAEATRLNKELARLGGIKDKLVGAMAVPAYATRVPLSKQAEDAAKLDDLSSQVAQVERALAQFA
ncbi:hypothetical protein KFE25_012010 [Diacronema lutheri]|uniref:valine--tRNA ligase n=2 Tax=Diacronema lutheri TaxID=2081491 RepID=A0A8J6C1X5_DIALT|nr:hypothetical protein KFE25_012010 [Diacronema lutheri]